MDIVIVLLLFLTVDAINSLNRKVEKIKEWLNERDRRSSESSN